MYVTRPTSIACVFLNRLVNGIMGNKLKSENLLRTSGLNYTIVRPGGLKGDYKDKLIENPVS